LGVDWELVSTFGFHAERVQIRRFQELRSLFVERISAEDLGQLPRRVVDAYRRIDQTRCASSKAMLNDSFVG